MTNLGSTRFLQKLRLRVLAMLTAVIIAAVAVISLGFWPVPVVSVALLTVAAMLNSMTSQLAVSVCSGCGRDLAGVPTGAYGAVCPGCGTLNSTLPADWDTETRLVADEDPAAETDDDATPRA